MLGYLSVIMYWLYTTSVQHYITKVQMFMFNLYKHVFYHCYNVGLKLCIEPCNNGEMKQNIMSPSGYFNTKHSNCSGSRGFYVAFQGPVSLKFYEFEIRVSFRNKNFAHSTWSKLLWCVKNVLLKNVIIQSLDLLIKLQERRVPLFHTGTRVSPNWCPMEISGLHLGGVFHMPQCNPMHGYCYKENESTVIIETHFINISTNWYQYKHIPAKYITLAK